MRVDEAAICSKCGKTATLIMNQKADSLELNEEVDLSVYECQTRLCLHFAFRWVVQSDSRGNVYERNKGPGGMDKDFIPMSPGALSRGKSQVEDIIRQEIED